MTKETVTAHTVYYLVHRDTGLRLKWYRTLAGARIAQRSRNHRLGFVERVRRLQDDHCELELCLTLDGTEHMATYAIVEDTVDRVEELYTQ